jgi:hypothetical protein
MEIVIMPFIVAGIIWAVWKVRTKHRAEDMAHLDNAWRVVLNDPNYMHRRRYEEYSHEVEAQARKAEAQARKAEGL